MKGITLVQIVGTPVACADGIKESWQEVATWTKHKLSERFGEMVKVEYYDLFDPSCPSLPENSKIPVVLIDGKIFSNGGKISLIAIRKSIEAIV